MNFGYGMYLAYMQIRDACSVAPPEHSPFAMISSILRQDGDLADQSLCCLFMLMKELLSLHVVPQETLMKTIKTLLPFRWAHSDTHNDASALPLSLISHAPALPPFPGSLPLDPD